MEITKIRKRSGTTFSKYLKNTYKKRSRHEAIIEQPVGPHPKRHSGNKKSEDVPCKTASIAKNLEKKKRTDGRTDRPFFSQVWPE